MATIEDSTFVSVLASIDDKVLDKISVGDTELVHDNRLLTYIYFCL